MVGLNDNFKIWNERCNFAQKSLAVLFQDEKDGSMIQGVPPENPSNNNFCYWWHAHAIDVLIDGYLRTGDRSYTERAEKVLKNVLAKNGGGITNLYYDDMEWMALALLRTWECTRKDEYRDLVFTLWEDIKKGWNGNMGGGIAWRKTQLDYKNTPANAPASILASRLYRRFKREDDMLWAKRVYCWNRENLTDPETGFVWDGMNRNGDGKIDKDWVFTYCQGVVIGAALELYRNTGEEKYRNDAESTWKASVSVIARPAGGILPDEGGGDCGLFKGIYIRYIRELYETVPGHGDIAALISSNAESLWRHMDRASGLMSRGWAKEAEPTVDLSTQLSGVMLFEAMASLQRSAENCGGSKKSG